MVREWRLRVKKGACMKKIGIITFSNSTNYGGVLQSVALSYTLRKLGMEPINITCQKMPSAWNSPKKYVRRRVRLYGSKGIKAKIRICGGVGKTFFSNVHYFSAKSKIRNFQKFINENLTVTQYYETDIQLKNICCSFDAYILGSDQVWNNSFTDNRFKSIYFLEFVPKSIPCYSYAASAGGEKSDSYILEIIQRTRDFVGITVREKSLEEHMKRLGCEKVNTVLDPTLLLSREEWINFEKKPKKIPKHYILVYYLERSSGNDPVIKKIAERYDLPVIDIMPDYRKAGYRRVIDNTAGPAEFLYYVHHADFVITNSFHMTVFSIIFGRKFVALKRTGQESRIHDLLQQVNMSSRFIDDVDDCGVIDEHVNSYEKNLKKYMMDSIDYLKNIGEPK